MKAGLADGSVDIVIGTHALLGQGIKFKDLALLVVDEEQHFGVAHKERLKTLRSEVHVLTLTATPIPRTLQLALTGVRDLSIIASPPVDRLAVRTFVSPFDPLTVREALLREQYRGGQAFYVCPRIEDLAGAKEFLDKTVPEVRVAVAHGQMPPTVLDDIMSAFYDGKYDVLLSTTIIESGLDIPTANTLIVHRADMFGLAQLYQLRGRVGRAKLRAYALFTLPAQQKITAQAERRLKVLQSLDTLGAGFQLASHDLDIRGAGNLLGEEQSGHIKEVGFELYQQMLEEAVMSLKAGITAPVADRWSPQITIGTPVLIPEDYVADLSVRLALYRRLAEIEDEREIDGFRRRAGRPLRPAAGGGRASAAGRGDQGAVPARQCREDRGRAEGRGAVVPRQCFRQSGRLDRLHPRAGFGRAHAQRSEGRQEPAARVLRRLGAAGGAAQGHGGDLAPSWCRSRSRPRRRERVRQPDSGILNTGLMALARAFELGGGAVDVGEIVKCDQALDRKAAGGDVVDQRGDELLRHAVALDDAAHGAAVLQKRRLERDFGALARAAEQHTGAGRHQRVDRLAKDGRQRGGLQRIASAKSGDLADLARPHWCGRCD